MPHRTLLALVLTAAAQSGGCGTIYNIKQPAVAPPDRPGADLCRVYGGVRGDWDNFWHYPWNPATPHVDYVCIPLLAACNLFLDGVGDTITLPCTAVKAMRRALAHSSASASAPITVVVPVPEVAAAGGAPPAAAPPVTSRR